VDYIGDTWNKLIILETTGIIVMFVFFVLDYQKLALPIVSSFTAFFLIANLFYWARINETTASQAFITWRSIAGSLTFMGLCLVIVVAFAALFVVLNNTMVQMTKVTNTEVWDYSTPFEPFTSSELGLPFVDSVYEQYFSGLG